MKNGILKSMGLDEVPSAAFEFAAGIEVVFEPNQATIEKLKAERDARIAAGNTEGFTVDLTDDQMDAVIYMNFLGKRQGGVVLPGGLVPQSKVRVTEIGRIPKVELLQRTEAAFAKRADG